MICSNRKTRVFDPLGYETFIAHVSLNRETAFAVALKNPIPSLKLIAMQVVKAKSGSLTRYAPKPRFPEPPFPRLSDDDHSYFVRWKLPTEVLEAFDDNKRLRLSSPRIIKVAVFIMILEYLTDWPVFQERSYADHLLALAQLSASQGDGPPPLENKACPIIMKKDLR